MCHSSAAYVIVFSLPGGQMESWHKQFSSDSRIRHLIRNEAHVALCDLVKLWLDGSPRVKLLADTETGGLGTILQWLGGLVIRYAYMIDLHVPS